MRPKRRQRALLSDRQHVVLKRPINRRLKRLAQQPIAPATIQPRARQRSIKCVEPLSVDGRGHRIELKPLKRVALTLLPIATLLPAVRMLSAQQPTTLQDADMLAADGAGRHVRRLPN